MSDLTAGAWRNGASEGVLQFVAEVEERQGKNFRALPHEAAIIEMSNFLDAYDELTAELLQEEATTE